MWLRRVTGGYGGYQVVTEGYTRLQVVTGVIHLVTGVTEGYTWLLGLRRDTPGYGGYRGLH